MFTTRTIVRVILLIAALLCISVAKDTLLAQKSSVPKPQNRLALGENEVRQLMVLIEPNNDGKITKRAWMAFMEAEFDRLDKNRSGELDPKELTQSRLQASHFLSAGK